MERMLESMATVCVRELDAAGGYSYGINEIAPPELHEVISFKR